MLDKELNNKAYTVEYNEKKDTIKFEYMINSIAYSMTYYNVSDIKTISQANNFISHIKANIDFHLHYTN